MKFWVSSVDGYQVSKRDWSKRIEWATCPEPYKTELDAIGGQWVEGVLSNEGLAFEAISILSELNWGIESNPEAPPKFSEEVFLHVRALAEAMLSTSKRPEGSLTAELRSRALKFMHEEHIPRQHRMPG